MATKRIVVCLAALVLANTAFGAEPDGVSFFESRIRPLLAQHCVSCHGATKQESDLRLDRFDAMLRGGASGPAIVPKAPDESLLLVAVGYRNDDLKMPPKSRLSDAQIADLRRWVELGAPHPDAAGTAPVAPRAVDLAAGRNFWSFRPPVAAPLPNVARADWPQQPIDRFLLAALEARGFAPAPPADKRALIRRVTFDLTGLPPEPEQVAAFLADESPAAYEQLVERLLASPAYGERWGRHWLDVVRYADSNGLDENIAHGNAWRYRDYVVAAWNADKPFDRFAREQIAGDLLPADPAAGESARHERLVATGFLALGPKVLAEVDEMKMEMDIIDEQIDTFGRAFLGQTLGCARCHDHKFDPFATDDYYGLAGIFKSTKVMEHYRKIARWWENDLATDADRARLAAHQQRLVDQKATIARAVEAANQRLRESLPDGKLPVNPETRYPDETKAELKRLRDELTGLEKSPPEMPTAMGVSEREIVDVPVLLRGNHLSPGRKAPRRLPAVLAGESQPAFESNASGRLRLADWLVGPEQPLTSRVFVNRVWRWHFGQGLVRSPDNFGLLGERPENQPLLDWLAVRFREQGWSIKWLQRQIVLSAAYQMSGTADPSAARLDPENRLLGRMPPRRLEAESLRDALLAVSGRLDRQMGGSLLHVKNREFFFDHTSKDKTSYASVRRSLYLPIVRNHLYDVFQLFDYTDAAVPEGDRATTTVAPQSLFLLNGDLVADSARALAERLLDEHAVNSSAGDDAARVASLYERAFGRPATPAEIKQSLAFVARFEQTLNAQPDPRQRRLTAWQMLAHAVLASNEFLYLP